MRRPLIVMLLVGLCLSPLAAQEGAAGAAVSAWYRDHPRAPAYESIKDDLAALAALAAQADIPAGLLIESLNEAAAKGVPADETAAALKTRTAELIRLKGALDGLRRCLPDSADGDDRAWKDSLIAYAQFLRRGVPPEAIEGVLADCCARRTGPAVAGDAFRTIAAIPSLRELSTEKITTLGRAIVSSGLAPSSFTALSSLYIKGKLKNLGTREITDIIIQTLEQGKGLIRIEQELNRRGGQ